MGVPIGFLTAVYLAKLAPPKIKSAMQSAVSLLAGIPSVVYGLVGMMVLVPNIRKIFHVPDGASLLAAIVVLAIMILPSIIKVSVTALEAVPKDYEDASLALGATPIETYFKVSVPAARSGIAAAVVLGVLLSLLFAAHWTEGYADMIQKGIGGKVVRFHVLANSDSEADQTLKLAVRDRVLQEYGDLLETCTSKEETLAALKNAQQEISETAEAEVLAQGYTYPVRVSLVREEFPFKKYGDLIFPAGVYDALRIEIGEAKGKNWWCVLYPQMCYVDAAWGYSTEESHVRLQNTLTK